MPDLSEKKDEVALMAWGLWPSLGASVGRSFSPSSRTLTLVEEPMKQVQERSEEQESPQLSSAFTSTDVPEILSDKDEEDLTPTPHEGPGPAIGDEFARTPNGKLAPIVDEEPPPRALRSEALPFTPCAEVHPKTQLKSSAVAFTPRTRKPLSSVAKMFVPAR